MENNFLQSILKSGLFDIGDSDDRLKWLNQSVTQLVKYLKKNHPLIPKFSLVALDPNISDSEPILSDVENIVTKYWKALRGKYPDMPRNIHRGVILNALYKLGNEDPILARIIYLTSSNYYPYAKLGKEKEIVETLLTELGEIAEIHAIEEWSLIEEELKIKIGNLKFTNLKLGEAAFDTTILKPKLIEAAKHSPDGGNQVEHTENWSNHFATNATEGIANSVTDALEKFSNTISPSSIEDPINKFFGGVKKSIDAVLKLSFSSMIAVERRSRLLWWKETLYSPSLKKSYRDFSKNILPLIMGYDLDSQVAKITPISVDYLLKDTLYILNEKNNKTIKFKDFLIQLDKDPLKNDLLECFTEINETDGRISITDFIVLFMNKKVKATEFKLRTGIMKDAEISVSDLSVAIFHDLLTKRLTSK